MKPAMTPQQRSVTGEGRSAFEAYRELAVGDGGMLQLAYFEFVQLLFGGLPGLAGLGARALLYPPLFATCGSRPAFGRGVTLRRTGQVTIGSRVVVDDYATLDVRGAGSITLGDHVCIGRHSIVAAKDGVIDIGPGANIGSYCRIATQSRVQVGESVLIAAYAYIGPGNHQFGADGRPLIESEMEIKGGVSIGAHAWIGARATVLDGVTVGEGSIVGAHALVREDVAPGTIVAGTPAKIIGRVGE